MKKRLHWFLLSATILLVICTALPLIACNDTPAPPVQETTASDFEVSVSVSEPVTEPLTVPVTEFVTEPVTEPVTDSVTEPITESVTDPEPTPALIITGGLGEVYPYIDEMKAYLEAPYKANIADYAFETEYVAKPITLSWDVLADNIVDITLRYGLVGCSDEEMTVIDLTKNKKQYELYNLYKDSDYRWSVTAELENGETYTEEATFHTTALGPRVLRIRSVYNTRDAGGYTTESGLVTKQGMIIRGGALPAKLPEHAQAVFSEIGIRMELDLRGYSAESGWRTESPIEGAKLEQIQTNGYAEAFDEDWTGHFRDVFKLMANPDNYPMYVHCTAGADRTGTVIFLLNALLGVPEEQLIQDYELTSFSLWGIRSTYEADEGFGALFAMFLYKLNRYDGNTLSEKTESYMLSIGVTQEEIDSIRSIMLEDAPSAE